MRLAAEAVDGRGGRLQAASATPKRPAFASDIQSRATLMLEPPSCNQEGDTIAIGGAAPARRAVPARPPLGLSRKEARSEQVGEVVGGFPDTSWKKTKGLCLAA